MSLSHLTPDKIAPTAVVSLARATTRIAASKTIEEVVEQIRSSARTLIGCEGIAFIRREGDLCHYVEEDAIGPLWKGQTFPEVACISGWAMINRQTVVVRDIAKDDRIPYELYAGTFVRAVAMAPVCSDAPIGAIGAYWSQTYDPAHWEIETLEAIADAAAVAIGNIGLGAPASGTPASSVDTDFTKDIAIIGGIGAVSTILDVVLRMTGMGFAAVARVTETKWITCKALDHAGFGLKPGDELPIESTLCNEIRDHRQPIVFDDAATDPQYKDHHTPRIYGLRSYISMPIILANGSFWGTLCAIDSNPAKVKNPQVLGTFTVFAELIAHHLEASEQLEASERSLQQERNIAELREQFIAVLGHDLRNPLAAVDAGVSKLQKDGWTDRSPRVLNLMKASISRMTGLVDNVMDFTRSRLGGGISLDLTEADLRVTIGHVVDEVCIAHPDRDIAVSLDFEKDLRADHLRLAQMTSNLVSNAIAHGDADKLIKIVGRIRTGNVELCVANGGTRIPSSQLNKLFMPFERGETKPGVHGGVGLGLFIASEIAKAHGGQIDVASDDEQTTFTFRMPVRTGAGN